MLAHKTDVSVYHHKRTLQYVRLGKVLLESRGQTKSKRRAMISFSNGAAAETSNCKCEITLRTGGNEAQIIFWDAAPSCQLMVSKAIRERCGGLLSLILSGCPRLTLCLASVLVTQWCEKQPKAAFNNLGTKLLFISVWLSWRNDDQISENVQNIINE